MRYDLPNQTSIGSWVIFMNSHLFRLLDCWIVVDCESLVLTRNVQVQESLVFCWIVMDCESLVLKRNVQVQESLVFCWIVMDCESRVWKETSKFRNLWLLLDCSGLWISGLKKKRPSSGISGFCWVVVDCESLVLKRNVQVQESLVFCWIVMDCESRVYIKRNVQVQESLAFVGL